MSSSRDHSHVDLMKPLPQLPFLRHEALHVIDESPEPEHEHHQTPSRQRVAPLSPPYEWWTPNSQDDVFRSSPTYDSSRKVKSWRRTHSLVTPDSSPLQLLETPQSSSPWAETPRSRPLTYTPLVLSDSNCDDIDIALLERLTAPPKSDRQVQRQYGLNSPLQFQTRPRQLIRKKSATELHQQFRLPDDFSATGVQCCSPCRCVSLRMDVENFSVSEDEAEGNTTNVNSGPEMMEPDDAWTRPSLAALLLGIEKLRTRDR